MVRASRGAAKSYKEPDIDEDLVAPSSDEDEQPKKKRIIKAKERKAAASAAKENSAPAAEVDAPAKSGPMKQLPNGLWVADESVRNQSWSLSHGEALLHPFPVLVAPERLSSSGSSGGAPVFYQAPEEPEPPEPEKPASKSKVSGKTKAVAKKASGSGLSRFAFKAKARGGESDDDEAPSDEADSDEEEEEAPRPAKKAKGKKATPAVAKKSRASSRRSEEVDDLMDALHPDSERATVRKAARETRGRRASYAEPESDDEDSEDEAAPPSKRAGRAAARAESSGSDEEMDDAESDEEEASDDVSGESSDAAEEEQPSSPEAPRRRSSRQTATRSTAKGKAAPRGKGKAARGQPAASLRPRRAARDTPHAKELSSDAFESDDDDDGGAAGGRAGAAGRKRGSGAAPAPAPAEWKRRGHEWCGQKLRRFFNGQPSDGKIVRWLAADGDEAALWHMRHDDGDEEDLEEAEVAKAIAAYEQQKEAPSSMDEASADEQQQEEEEERNSEEDEEMDDEESDGESAAAAAAGERKVELVLGRRWAGGGKRKGVEYLVKWKGLSYLHVSWRHEAALLRDDPKLLPRLKKFSREAPPLPPPPPHVTGAKPLPRGEADGGEADGGVAEAEAAADNAMQTDEQPAPAATRVCAGLCVSAFAAAASAAAGGTAGPVRLSLSTQQQQQQAASDEGGAAAARRRGAGVVRDDTADWLPEGALEVEMVLAHRQKLGSSAEYLVKWGALPFAEASWEVAARLPPCEAQIRAYEAALKTPCVPPSKSVGAIRPARFEHMEESLVYGDLGRTLRSYQLDGVNWMLDCWHKRRNVLLADEMGLGKTAQCVATLHHVAELSAGANGGVGGPFLVVAPLSTIAHWKREFETWAPQLRTIVLHGEKADRAVLLKRLWHAERAGGGSGKAYYFHVVVTTYETLHTEQRALTQVPWQYVIVDEAHRLKNLESRSRLAVAALSYGQIALLTGTPVQNNTQELFSLLNLLDPRRFDDADAFEERYGTVSSTEQVEELQAALKPLMLRRLKDDVIDPNEIPAKEETIIWVELTAPQKHRYRALLDRNANMLASLAQQANGGRSAAPPSLSNVCMKLRQLCNHPRLLEKEDAPMPPAGSKGAERALAQLVEASGKMVLLHKLLPRLRAEGRKVLVFSQFCRMLDLLEDYLHLAQLPFERLDGSISGVARQASIDRFQRGDAATAFVFLLSTRAGGVGINLTAADTVVIFDSDWNPQNDVQGMARCHRIGQTQQVQVYRLITNNTYERGMFEKSCLKLGLDQALLSGSGGGKEGPSGGEMADLLKYGAYDVMKEGEDADAKQRAFCEATIDELLAQGHKMRHESTGAGGAFSKATFSSEGAAGDALDVHDPQFWAKLMPQRAATSPGLDRAARRRPAARSMVEGAGSEDDDEQANDYLAAVRRRSRAAGGGDASDDDVWGADALSDAEAELARKRKAEGGKEKGEKGSKRVVAAAVGRRVVCTGTGALRGRQVSGVYRDDGKIEVDEEGVALLRSTSAPPTTGVGGGAAAAATTSTDAAPAEAGVERTVAGDADADADADAPTAAAAAATKEEEGGGEEVSVSVGSLLSCGAFCKLAGNKSGYSYAQIVLADEPQKGACLLELEDPEGAKQGKYAKRALSAAANKAGKANAAANGADAAASNAKPWSKAERDRASRVLPSVGLADAARLQRAAQLSGRSLEQVSAFARGWLRYALALHAPADAAAAAAAVSADADASADAGVGATVGGKRVRPDAASSAAGVLAVGEEALLPTWWRDWLPTADAAETELWAQLLEDDKFEKALRRAALPALGKLVWLRALADVRVAPAPSDGDGDSGVDGASAQQSTQLKLPAEMEKALGGGSMAGGSLPAVWWGATQDRALLEHSAAHGLGLGEEEWVEKLARSPPFAPPKPTSEAAVAAAAEAADLADFQGGEAASAKAAAESAAGPPPVGLKAVLLRREKLLKRLQTVLYGAPTKSSAAKRAKFFGAAAASSSSSAAAVSGTASSFFFGGGGSKAKASAAAAAASAEAEAADARAEAQAAEEDAEEAAEEAAQIAEAQRRAREAAEAAKKGDSAEEAEGPMEVEEEETATAEEPKGAKSTAEEANEAASAPASEAPKPSDKAAPDPQPPAAAPQGKPADKEAASTPAAPSGPPAAFRRRILAAIDDGSTSNSPRIDSPSDGEASPATAGAGNKRKAVEAAVETIAPPATKPKPATELKPAQTATKQTGLLAFFGRK